MPVRPEHIVNLQGRDFVLFPGLLHLAHESGLRSIETELVQIPSGDNGNCAIIRALARFAGAEEDAVWSAYGDASPANTRGPISNALIRMAETRAIGRVLRMACDVGETLLEELADDETAGPRGGNGHGVRPIEHAPAPRLTTAEGREGGEPLCSFCAKPLGKNDIAFSQHHLKINACMVCARQKIDERAKEQSG